MEVFADLTKYAPIFAVVGAILFVLGLLLKANSKKETASGVISMIMMTLGVVLLLFATVQWISQSFGDWKIFSDRML